MPPPNETNRCEVSAMKITHVYLPMMSPTLLDGIISSAIS